MDRPVVAILLPTLLMGGAEKTLIELANCLAQREWRVQVLTMSSTGPLGGSLSPQVELIDLASATYRRAVLALIKHYDARHPDIVLTSVYATGLAAIAAKALSRFKPRIVVGAHNSLRTKIARPDNPKDKYLLLPLCRLLLTRADAFVPVSKGVAEELRATLRLPGEKVRVIYNPVVSPQLLVRSGEPVDHQWLGDASTRGFKTLVTVGRMVEQKGFDVLLKAFARLRQDQDCRLIVVGDGPLREDLETLAQTLEVRQLVDFVGLQENPHKFLSRADLFVLSSRWEGLGNVLIEALAAGCPVVSTDCRYGPREILDGETYGWLAPVDDPDRLAAAILDALRSEDSTRTDKARLRSRALDFSIDRAAERYESLFTALIGSE